MDVAVETTRVLKVFLFTDLVHSTGLKTRLGDSAVAESIAKHNALFRECLSRFGGVEVDNAGDGFFATFGVPSDALRCALEFQRGLAALKESDGLSARVGIHMGEIVQLPGGELVGLAVDTAARVMGLALPGQVLLTRHAFDSVRQHLKSAPDGCAIEWLAHGPYLFKGIDDPIEVCEAGVRDCSPLAPPEGSEKARRAVGPGAEETLGWRPAVGLAVPGRDEWQLERKLGEGGFGEVWLARHQVIGTCHAFKFCFEADRLRALKREITLIQLIKGELGDRDDIARLYDVRLSEAPFFLEMEYTNGGDLASWAEQRGGIGSVPLQSRLQIVAQLAHAIAAAHSVGVIHKDVKPANVLIHVDKDGTVQVRLTDFGIGQLVGPGESEGNQPLAPGTSGTTTQLTDLGSRTGTRLYMAPELIAQKTPTIRSDIYALGIVLYQVVTSDLERPLAQGWERDVEDDLLREDIAACIAGKPAERLGSADDLARRIHDLDKRRSQGAAERERAKLEAVRAAREKRRSRQLRLAGAAIAVVGVIAIVAVVAATKIHRSEIRLQAELLENESLRERMLLFWHAQARRDPIFQVLYKLPGETKHHPLDADQLPLMTGTLVQMVALLPEPGYPYVFHLTKGKAPRQLYPLPDTPIEPVSEVFIPSAATVLGKRMWFRLDPPATTEMFLLLVAEQPLEDVSAIEVELANFSVPALASDLMLLGNASSPGEYTTRLSRGLSVGPISEPTSALDIRSHLPELAGVRASGTRKLLDERFTSQFRHAAVIAFPHTDEDPLEVGENFDEGEPK